MSDSVIGALRQPEYTGENRCMACTAVNAVIAVGLGVMVAVGLAAGSVAGPAVATAAGVGVLAVGAAAIYLRGYLVPGTPELTKRYFPPWLLALFGKAAGPGVAGPSGDLRDLAAAGPLGVGGDPDVDTETALLDAGALELAGEELQLTDRFRDGFRDRVAALRDQHVDVDRVLDALNVDRVRGEVELVEDDGLMILQFPDGAVDQPVAIWESRGALRADIATSAVLADLDDDYARMGPAERGHLLRGARVFVEQCPDCEGPTGLGERTVESCCFASEVAVIDCQECGTDLVEVPM